MLSLSINLRNPFSNRWRCLYTKAGPISEHKYWEVQIDKCDDIVGFEFRYTIRQDHAGLFLSFALFGYDIIFNTYDTRHWNDEEGRWYVYGPDGKAV